MLECHEGQSMDQGYECRRSRSPTRESAPFFSTPVLARPF